MVGVVSGAEARVGGGAVSGAGDVAAEKRLPRRVPPQPVAGVLRPAATIISALVAIGREVLVKLRID